MNEKKTITEDQTHHNTIGKQKKSFVIFSSLIAFSERLASSRYLKWILAALLPV